MDDSAQVDFGEVELVDDIVMEDSSDFPIEPSRRGEDCGLKGKQPEGTNSSQEEDGDGDFESPNSTPPPKADEIDRRQYHVDLQEWGQCLQEAAQAAFPNHANSRYRNVYVLMLKWQEEDLQLPVSYDVPELWEVFKETYGFETELWEIPSHDSHTEVNQKIIDFSRFGGNGKHDLKILYYAGHGKITRNRLLSWTSWRNNDKMKCPTVKWSGIQNVLEEAENDVLLLLDCCNAGVASTDEGEGLTELISACAYNSKANGVGYYSFTHALVLELRALALHSHFSVGELYNRIYCRVQSRMPEDERSKEERHPAPVHPRLTCYRRFPRGIQLSPRKNRRRPGDREAQVPDSTIPSNLNTPSGDDHHKGEKVPRLALAIRFKDDLNVKQLSADLFAEWLRSMPIVAEQVKIEAGFGSFSTLLIVSIPFSLSAYLKSDPAVIWLGPITSSNLVIPTQHPLLHAAAAGPGVPSTETGKIQHLAPPSKLSRRTSDSLGEAPKSTLTPQRFFPLDQSPPTEQLRASIGDVAPETPAASGSGAAEEEPVALASYESQEEEEYDDNFDEALDIGDGTRSFLFIVNELPTNDNPHLEGSIPPRIFDGRYFPPEVTEGYLPQIPGYVFRWRDGVVTIAPDYCWPPDYRRLCAQRESRVVWPKVYSAATVFYCNHFTKFFTARGDASTRDMNDHNTDPEDIWQPLSFYHKNNNISYVSHAGDQDFLAVRRASWIDQLLPNTYRRDSRAGPDHGGLSGLLPIVISLVAFSCVNRDELYRVLISDQAWTRHRWVPHDRQSGRIERRGIVVTVHLDPENPTGSTHETISELENGPTPIFR